MDSGDRARHTVGVRDLKNKLSEMLRRVRAGESIVVTDRGRAVARLVPAREDDEHEVLHALTLTGRFSWSGGKPLGSTGIPRLRGQPAADAVAKDRR